ncbi:hypothetical protein GCM10009555_074610 [Acrocarpospora macrocephala]|uniref:Uncharacterized protein n=1 Tax=Acrocarpospora macrocephala TaxID=150177 RepID=A0A5M3WRZ7_9ACTN|nr:hypothetical protein [Acrocarpospora macrocephala]GES11380.1 hypothetical protein Amac_049770 [Acrocarpospora macrocephala]
MADRARPVIVLDPSLPFAIRQLLETNEELLRRVRQGLVPETPKSPRPIVIACAAVLAFAGIFGGFSTFLILAGMTGFVTLLNRLLTADQREARRKLQIVYDHRDRIVLPSDLDEQCGSLLARAQKAVKAVLHSKVHRQGLLDTDHNNVALPGEAWVIAKRLSDLSALRDKHRKIVGRNPDPLIAEADAPYSTTIKEITASLTSRVVALEAYAARARDADRLFDAFRKVTELHDLTPEFQRLLAETAPDAMATAEIAQMSTQAVAIEQVFRASIAEARQAGTHLLSVSAA